MRILIHEVGEIVTYYSYPQTVSVYSHVFIITFLMGPTGTESMNILVSSRRTFYSFIFIHLQTVYIGHSANFSFSHVTIRSNREYVLFRMFLQ